MELDNLPFNVSAFDILNEAVVIIDVASTIVYLNTPATKLYGVTKEAIVGKKLEELYIQEWAQESEHETLLQLKEKGYWSGETMHVSKNGKKMSVHLSISAFQDSTGNSLGTVLIVDRNFSFCAFNLSGFPSVLTPKT